MSSINSVNDLNVTISKATFAQPRKYYITIQYVSNKNNIDHKINKYKTNTSQITKQPEFKSTPFKIPINKPIKSCYVMLYIIFSYI